MAKIYLTDMTTCPWTSRTESNALNTLKEAKQWCEEMYTELRFALD